jgi:hypothetical protein
MRHPVKKATRHDSTPSQTRRSPGFTADPCDNRGHVRTASAVLDAARHRLSLIVAALLVFSACGTSPPPSSTPTTPPSPSPSPSAAPSATASPASSAEVDAIYDAIEQQVIEIRGLEPTGDVERRVIDEAELRTLITAEFDEETPPEYVAANERLYKALGLIAPDANLRDLTLDLLSGGVAGFYRPDEKTLYVVSKTGLPGVNERITFAHEYDHALQDQHTSVFEDQDGVLDQTDRILARQAVYEGDASLLMTLWGAENFDVNDLAELLALGNDPEQLALLERMPSILKETLLFPYTTGLAYVQGTQLQGGWEAVNDFYDRMPESTEQILHPETYASDEDPIEVDIPDDLAAQLGDGWSVAFEDTFGELQLGIWLRETGLDPAVESTATTGWGGDRLAVVEGPDGAWGVVLETAWDSAGDATEFADAATSAVESLSDVVQVSAPAGERVTIVIASDEEALLALDVVFGGTGV